MKSSLNGFISGGSGLLKVQNIQPKLDSAQMSNITCEYPIYCTTSLLKRKGLANQPVLL